MKREAAQLRTSVRELVEELAGEAPPHQRCEMCGSPDEVGVLLVATNVLPRQLDDGHIGEICASFHLCQFHRATAAGLVMQVLLLITNVKKRQPL